MEHPMNWAEELEAAELRLLEAIWSLERALLDQEESLGTIKSDLFLLKKHFFKEEIGTDQTQCCHD